MKRYEQYKNSGINWMEEIPSHWEVRKLKHSVDLINDKTSETGLCYVGLEHIESFSGKLLPLSNIEPESICNKFQAKDILFCKLRPYLAKCILIDFSGKCTSELLVLRNFKGEEKFLNYLLLSPKIVMHINASTYGSKMPRANWFFIGSCHIPLPAKEEQHTIVTFLDTKVNKIDSYIATAEKKIAALDELKKVTIANAVTHGIHPNVPMKDSGIRWIGQVPKHWEIRKLSQVAFEHYISNKTIHHQNLLSLSYGKIIRKDINTTDGLLPASFDGYQIIEPGNIILRLTDLQNDHRSLRVGLVPEVGIITSAYLCLGVRIMIKSNYLYFQLHSYDIKKLFYSMGDGLRQSLNYEGIRKLFIVVPPLSEQVEIVSYIDHKVAQIDKMRNAELAQIEKLKEYKQRLISDVVTGKVKV